MQLKHIALQIKEKDITAFYKDIMGMQFDGETELKKEDAHKLFTIPADTRILFADADAIKFEFFISDFSNRLSFNHICMTTGKARNMYLKAKDAEYFTRMHNETYFISDSAGNTFELKLQ